MTNPMCSNCGGSTMSMEEQQIRAENARLKEELAHVRALAIKFPDRPLSELTATLLPMGDGVMETAPNSEMIGNNTQKERSKLIDLASAAMDELIKLSELDSHLWIKSPESGNEVLEHDEYEKISCLFNTQKPNGFATKATRETVLLYTNIAALIETLLDADRWAKMFSYMIVEAKTLEVLSNGMDGSRNESMQVMHAKIQFPTPLVSVQEYSFIRFCKQQVEGKWAVLDVSIDFDRNGPNGNPYMSCMRLLSGCTLQDMHNGFCKITWIDHSQYDESVLHQTYSPLVNAGITFGVYRWVATLRKHLQSLSTVKSFVPSDHPTAICSSGERSMLKLSQRMSRYFWSDVCPSSELKWDLPFNYNMGNNEIRIVSRKIPNAFGENPSIVLSASTSIWMPMSQQRVFDFLRDAKMRGEWDVLCNGGSMQEMVCVATGEGIANSISILCADNAVKGNMLYLQSSFTSNSGSMIVYSPISLESLIILMNGGDSSFVPLLPSGFLIDSGSGSGSSNSGCWLTVGLQMLLSGHETSNLTNESGGTINERISCTIQKIKDVLGVA